MPGIAFLLFEDRAGLDLGDLDHWSSFLGRSCKGWDARRRPVRTWCERVGKNRRCSVGSDGQAVNVLRCLRADPAFGQVAGDGLGRAFRRVTVSAAAGGDDRYDLPRFQVDHAREIRAPVAEIKVRAIGLPAAFKAPGMRGHARAFDGEPAGTLGAIHPPDAHATAEGAHARAVVHQFIAQQGQRVFQLQRLDRQVRGVGQPRHGCPTARRPWGVPRPRRRWFPGTPRCCPRHRCR